MPVKKLLIPYAISGDRAPIPDAIDISGGLSYTQGWTQLYANDKNIAPARDVPRREMNQLFHDITSGIRQYQTTGVPEYITAIENGGNNFSYAKNAIVMYSDGNVYLSLRNNNNDLPTVAASWGLLQYNGRSGHTYNTNPAIGSDWCWLDRSAGLIKQWGIVGVTTGSTLFENGFYTGTTTVTYPTPFASGDNIPVVSPLDTVGVEGAAAWYSPTSTGFSLTSNNTRAGISAYASYSAIGIKAP
jgi:hypothetical protein